MALVVAAAVLAAPSATAACRCAGPRSMLTSYFRQGIDSVVIVTPQRIVPSTSPSLQTYSLLRGPFPFNTTIYKGCPRNLERFSMFGPATSCFSSIKLGEPILLFLSDKRFAGPCDYNVPASALTPGDIAFLNRRTGCGSCAAGNEVQCVKAPCMLSRPCDASGSCKDNYCGGCYAEWYRSDGTPQVCDPQGSWGGWYPKSSPTPVRTKSPLRDWKARATQLPRAGDAIKLAAAPDVP
ncbi:hypothetical protein MMPV_005760 [Pyropia vietnamensis]